MLVQHFGPSFTIPRFSSYCPKETWILPSTSYRASYRDSSWWESVGRTDFAIFGCSLLASACFGKLLLKMYWTQGCWASSKNSTSVPCSPLAAEFLHRSLSTPRQTPSKLKVPLSGNRSASPSRLNSNSSHSWAHCTSRSDFINLLLQLPSSYLDLSVC